MALADRIVVMNDGRIQQIGTHAISTTSPRNRFVASFIGRTNFFAGAVTGARRFRHRERPRASLSPASRGREQLLAIRPERVRARSAAAAPRTASPAQSSS